MNERTLFGFLAISVSWLLLGSSAIAASPPEGTRTFPLPIESYRDEGINSTVGKLVRVRVEPLNLVAALVFLCAIIHTFLARKFLSISLRLKNRCDILQWLEGHPEEGDIHAKNHDRRSSEPSCSISWERSRQFSEFG
jgi:hypothetical protein